MGLENANMNEATSIVWMQVLKLGHAVILVEVISVVFDGLQYDVLSLSICGSELNEIRANQNDGFKTSF